MNASSHISTSLHRIRARGRSIAVRYAGLPHSVGTIDSPSPEVAHDVTELWKRNSFSNTRIVDPSASEVVTMTTHGPRLESVWIAIESIGRGTALPRRIVLWLDAPVSRLPFRLWRLTRRGLEIRFTEPGLGVHTKYWPYLQSERLAGPLVTSDDDILYPPSWLEQMREAHRNDPGCVIAHRAKTVTMSSPSAFAPYIEWSTCASASPSYAHLGTSVSGQLFPVELQRQIRADGPDFLGVAPTNDDVWLHREAVAHGFPTKQITERAEHWPFVPGSQVVALQYTNVFGGANDRQLAASHTPQTLARIWAALTSDSPAQ